MKFDVHIDKEQIEEIAKLTADKVLETNKYLNNNLSWYEDKNEKLKHKINYLNEKIVQKDIQVERWKDKYKKCRDKFEHKYLIIITDDNIDDFILTINQDINRPNNPTDDAVIKQYMENNYWYHDYEIIELSNVEDIKL